MYTHLRKLETELTLKAYAANTIRTYINHVKLFLQHFAREPDEITEQEIKDYLKSSQSQAQLKQRIGALKYFYTAVVKQPLKFRYIEYPRRESKLPQLLSQDEIREIFAVCTNTKHRAILFLMYSTGMRESEIINLRIADIDSSRMLIHIRNGKGARDRFVPLSENTLTLLRQYFREYTPREYLFNGQFSPRYSATSIQAIAKKYARLAGISKRVYPHLIRHCSATHLYEAGTDISIIQRMLGHRSHKTTMRYAQMSNRFLSKIKTPDSFL